MIKLLLRTVFRSLRSIQDWADEGAENERTYQNSQININQQNNKNINQISKMSVPQYRVINVWNYLTFKEGSQAHHITKILDFEEWIPMEEILRRVNELFGIQYQNERSLYPYLKTLVDAGLLEASMLGGKMRWRKKNLMQTINLMEEIENEVVVHSQPLQ
ncbi:MAG: hypothetical protein FJY86_00700 [Candidatus Diapherotrites archaeon]|uniref:Uncharacterized protein n=1 Tax=Candidatus Iainarchaeum sp. TaxID=3101447 RepID=A0A8T4C6P1_9ARCH|nr:hypothetical protein [Candidatus Diapherotrites archaeon]